MAFLPSRVRRENPPKTFGQIRFRARATRGSRPRPVARGDGRTRRINVQIATAGRRAHGSRSSDGAGRRRTGGHGLWRLDAETAGRRRRPCAQRRRGGRSDRHVAPVVRVGGGGRRAAEAAAAAETEAAAPVTGNRRHTEAAGTPRRPRARDNRRPRPGRIHRCFAGSAIVLGCAARGVVVKKMPRVLLQYRKLPGRS